MAENDGPPPTDAEVNDTNERRITVASTASELTRILTSAGLVPAKGRYSQNDEENDEEEGEDYVAVDHEDASDVSYLFRRPQPRPRTQLDELHPFVSVLSLSNVDDCVRVEESLPEHERCTREKLCYRLTKCPELSLGLFTIPVLEEDKPKPRATLIGHIIATRTSAPTVTDASMSYPPDWRTKRRSLPDDKEEPLGHQDQGGTIAIHSLAVLPEYQGKKVGTTLMKSYIHRIKEAAIADRIALIAHDHLIPFYEKLGFENRGPSKCTFGGGGWTDMVLEFNKE
ncbi:hypothetical protein VTN77DRAFT_7356 [Rasamsonia byssochlamydoides]|uniref:uncharacterized protein n=1 Tax=Rasamsonia byssochlamydoides TaxID=89139 RepID=UPI003742F863